MYVTLIIIVYEVLLKPSVTENSIICSPTSVNWVGDTLSIVAPEESTVVERVTVGEET